MNYRANQLDGEGVRNARAEEVDFVRRYAAYEKVAIEERWSTVRKKPIGARWIDIHKGDAVNPEYGEG